MDNDLFYSIKNTLECDIKFWRDLLMTATNDQRKIRISRLIKRKEQDLKKFIDSYEK